MKEMQTPSDRNPGGGEMSLPPPLPVTSINLLDGGVWRGFFSLTGGSILYCLSALSIIYGIARLLGPLLARTDALRGAYPCLAALNIYEICLLGVLVFIVIRARIMDDAVSLVVLVALFLVGDGIALSAVANGGPRETPVIGLLCFLLGAGKLHVLRRYVRLALNWGMLAGLGVILAWNFGAGSMLARLAVEGAVAREHWLTAWLFVIAGGAIVFLAGEKEAWALARTDAAPRLPFLCRPGMALLFAAILLIAGAVHQYVLGYVYEVPSDAGDYLPLVGVVSLVVLQLSVSLRRRASLFEACLAGVPLAACGLAVLSKSVIAVPPSGVRLIWHPSAFLGFTGAAVLAVWVRTRSRRLLVVCGAYLLGVILTVGYSPVRPLDLNWHVTGGVLVAALMLIGLVRRNVALCLLAVIVATIGVATTGSFAAFLQTWKLTHSGAVAGVAGMGILALAVVFGREMTPILTGIGALGVMIFIFDLLPTGSGAVDLFSLAGALVAGAAIWLRVRHWPSVAFLLAPVVQRAWAFSTRFTAWRFVALSFVLLFAGAWLSVRKSRKPAGSGLTAGPAAETSGRAAQPGEPEQGADSRPSEAMR
ncbi:MAG: hypothetical protein FJ225_10705 [Lentisphaerae bacterium]|nr:hypothetical protein [Lentisphaerota bacterium]